MRSHAPPVEPVTNIGIDDFAWKKGHRYGTIVVNLLTHQVIERQKNDEKMFKE